MVEQIMEDRRQQVVVEWEKDTAAVALSNSQETRPHINTENMTAVHYKSKDGHAWEGLISEERLLPLWKIRRCNPSTHELQLLLNWGSGAAKTKDWLVFLLPQQSLALTLCYHH